MATNPKTSLFDGTFCRKPNQNFGGRRTNESREILLKKAKMDREKREKERQVAQSIVVVQASVRSFLVRQAFKRHAREEYDKNKKQAYNEEEFGRQLQLLTQFYDPTTDSTRLQEMAWWVLKEQVYVLDKCNKRDFLWIHRMRLLARYCISALRNALSVPASTRYLRLIEIFTEERKSVEVSAPSYFCIVIWLDLIERGNFFRLWREILESRQSGTYNAATPAYMDILDRSVNLISRLKHFSEPVTFSPDKLTANQVCDFIFSRFVEAFGRQVIPDASGADGNPQVVALEILPRISLSFPFTEFLHFLLSYESPPDEDSDRSMLYIILVLSKSRNDVDPLLLTRLVLKFLGSIDKTYAPVNSYRTDFLYQLHISATKFPDLEDLEDFANENSQIRYLKDVHIIYHMLADAVEHPMQLVSLLNPSTMEYWDWFCRIVSCLVCIDERTSERIPYLATIAFRKDILRLAFLKIQANWDELPILSQSQGRNEELIGFCWGFNHLLGALHDDEFLSAIPMNVKEAETLIRKMVAIYERIGAIDPGRYDALHNAVKYSLLWTLRSLYDRNTRLQYVPDDCFQSPSAHVFLPLESHPFDLYSLSHHRAVSFRRSAFFLTDPRDYVAYESRLLQILNEAPFLLSFDNRVNVWHRLLDNDKMNNDVPINPREHIQIRRSMLYEDAYEKLSAENVPDLRTNVRISLVNIVGAPEAGVDGGGLLREFLIEAAKAGVDPNRGFFRLDSQNRIYPNPVARVMDPNFRKHFFLMGRLVGKALYEQILLELPFAAFFIQACISGHVPSAVDYLATLDPALHKNLLNLRNYQGDWNAIGLDFTVTNEEFGKVRSIELKKNGAEMSVNKSNVIEYIHLVAEYKINKEMEDECRSFRQGFLDVIPVLRMFSWREMKTLISGSDKPINVQDWKANINYSGGYAADHPTILLFWQVVESFQEEYLRKLLKFVTSCSRPPLLGFKYLIPNFGIQNTGFDTDRLPTAATCMNLLKLPQYADENVIRQKLMYVVDAQAGFELS